MKKLFNTFLMIVLSGACFAQSVIQNNTTSVSITPNGIRTNHPPSNDPTNTALGLDALKLNVGKSNNTAFGANALKNNSVGSTESYHSNNNSAFGANALMNNTTGFQNSAFGSDAMDNNTSGVYNAAFGYGSLGNNSIGGRNVAMGWAALNGNTTGGSNTGVGFAALEDNVSGISNIAVGSESLRNNTTGFYNVAIGADALLQNKAGSKSTAVGSEALKNANNTTAAVDNDNVAVGYRAMYGSASPVNNTGKFNTAIGDLTLEDFTSGSNNIALGFSALTNTTVGNFNSAIGINTLFNNVANNRSTAVGYGAMERADNRLTGRDTYNTAVGVFALRGSGTAANNTGINNTAIGDLVMADNTSGSGNVAVGKDALQSNSSGSNNTIIGYGAGSANTSGNNNIYIGYQAGSTNSSNNLVIENSNSAQPLIRGDFSGDKLGINRTFADLVGRGETFQVTGEAFKTVGTGNWIIPSDRRLKENITYLDSQEMLDKVLKLRGVTFNWKDKNKGREEVYGFIAQELQTVFPSNVKTDKEGYLSASYGSYDPMLVGAIKALKELIDNQKEVVEKQNQQISRLEQELTALKKQIASVATEGQVEVKTKK